MSEQDHEVQEDRIMLVSLLMAELGVHSVAYAFPKVKIITTAVDKNLDDCLHVIPGIGKRSEFLNKCLNYEVSCSCSHYINVIIEETDKRCFKKSIPLFP